ncbi:MAG: 2-C-methyl-D-erythritol 4-phosphate cytidylyltransferase, partial [Candidatus Puniceispirillaceae bacterium]
MKDKMISRPGQSGSNSCAAIIVAAGSGVRAASAHKFNARQNSPFENDNFGHDLPKQFWRLGDKPVIAHAFDYFHQHPAIAAIILVVAEPYITHMTNILPETQKPVRLIAGGATRQNSVHAGLIALAGLKDYQNINYVTIHDAARPLIPT